MRRVVVLYCIVQIQSHCYLPQIRGEHVDDDAVDERDAERSERLENARQHQVLRRVGHVVEADRDDSRDDERHDCQKTEIESQPSANYYTLAYYVLDIILLSGVHSQKNWGHGQEN